MAKTKRKYVKRVPLAKKQEVELVGEEVVNEFILTLKLGQEVYSSTGHTMYEALSCLPHPMKMLVKGVLTIQHGDYKRDMLMQPHRLRRLFWPNAQEIQAKVLSMGMK